MRVAFQDKPTSNSTNSRTNYIKRNEIKRGRDWIDNVLFDCCLSWDREDAPKNYAFPPGFPYINQLINY